MKEKKTIVLASPRGPCAGVNRALEIIEEVLRRFGTPLYVNHDLVHNQHVVNTLRERGVLFSKDLDAIPNRSIYLFSAHGVSPKFRQEAEKRNLILIDATCPLVTKVHIEAARLTKTGHFLFFIGHRGHPEVEGTTGVAEMRLIESVSDVKALSAQDVPEGKPIAVLTQTTLSVRETEEILTALKRLFPEIVLPSKKDICYATTNRQKATEELAKQCDSILVVGSKHSSNSNRLRETAENVGVRALLVDFPKDIPDDFLQEAQRIGITSGASVPEILVQNVIDHILQKFPKTEVQNLSVLEENVRFPLPKFPT
ncbi:4-hydroxy-3-methylbut-2-enyl diphosphate reductase [Candidatus Peregrinibacteria bacterium]|nr:MAG: 4-hydroxy-3-methylbut-2-enyl diphosphate reductase [Candidatus Peregrinibacteria bacterium]